MPAQKPSGRRRSGGSTIGGSDCCNGGLGSVGVVVVVVVCRVDGAVGLLVGDDNDDVWTLVGVVMTGCNRVVVGLGFIC